MPHPTSNPTGGLSLNDLIPSLGNNNNTNSRIAKQATYGHPSNGGAAPGLQHPHVTASHYPNHGQDSASLYLSNPLSGTSTTNQLFQSKNPEIFHKNFSGDEGEEIDHNWSLKDIENKRHILLQWVYRNKNEVMARKINKMFEELDGLVLVQDSLSVEKLRSLRHDILSRIQSFIQMQDKVRISEEDALKKTFKNLEWSYWRVWIVVKISFRLVDWWWKGTGRPALLKKYGSDREAHAQQTAQSGGAEVVFQVHFPNSWREHFMNFWAKILRHLPKEFDLKPHFAIVVAWLFFTCKGHVGFTLKDLMNRFAFYATQSYYAIFEGEFHGNIKKENKSLSDFVSILELEEEVAQKQKMSVTKLERKWMTELCSPKLNLTELFADACRLSNNMEELRDYDAFAVAQYLLQQLEVRCGGDFSKLENGSIIKKRVEKIVQLFAEKPLGMHATRLSENANKWRRYPPAVEVFYHMTVRCKERMIDLMVKLEENGFDLMQLIAQITGDLTVEELKSSIGAFGDKGARNRMTLRELPLQPIHMITVPQFDQFPIFQDWAADVEQDDLLDTYKCKRCSGEKKFASQSFADYVRHSYYGHGISPHKYHKESLRAVAKRIGILTEDLSSEFDFLPASLQIATQAVEEYSKPLAEKYKSLKAEKYSALECSLVLGVPFNELGKLSALLRKKPDPSASTVRRYDRAASRDAVFLAILFGLKNSCRFIDIPPLLGITLAATKHRYYRAKKAGLDKDPFVQENMHRPKDELLEWYSREFIAGDRKEYVKKHKVVKKESTLKRLERDKELQKKHDQSASANTPSTTTNSKPEKKKSKKRRKTKADLETYQQVKGKAKTSSNPNTTVSTNNSKKKQNSQKQASAKSQNINESNPPAGNGSTSKKRKKGKKNNTPKKEEPTMSNKSNSSTKNKPVSNKKNANRSKTPSDISKPKSNTTTKKNNNPAPKKKNSKEQNKSSSAKTSTSKPKTPSAAVGNTSATGKKKKNKAAPTNPSSGISKPNPKANNSNAASKKKNNAAASKKKGSNKPKNPAGSNNPNNSAGGGKRGKKRKGAITNLSAQRQKKKQKTK